jgi:hypothetical protein
LRAGVDRDYWLDSTAVVALAGPRAELCEFGDDPWHHGEGDSEILDVLLDAVDRHERQAVFDRWGEQVFALFRTPTFMPAVRSVADRLEERITLSGFEVAEIVEAVEARGSKELPTWVPDRGGMTVVDLRQWRLAKLQRHNAEMLETLNDLSQCVRALPLRRHQAGAGSQSSGRYGGPPAGPFAGCQRPTAGGITWEIDPALLPTLPGALCAGHSHPEIWFDPIHKREAVAICRTCPAIEACRVLCDELEAGKPLGEWVGIWAAEDPRQRRRRRQGAKR